MKATFWIAAAAASAASGAYALDACSDSSGCRSFALRDRDIGAMQLAMTDAPRTPSLAKRLRDEPTTAAERREAASRKGKGKSGRPGGARYKDKDQAAFVRGGKIFAAQGDGLVDGSGTEVFAAGYRRDVSSGSSFKFEGEIVYQKDAEPALVGVGLQDASVLGVTGLVGARWEARQFGPVTPFVSGGFGPHYTSSTLDDGQSALKDSQMGLGYSARVGVEAAVIGPISIEAAYRYLDATTDDAFGIHAGEIGLTYNF